MKTAIFGLMLAVVLGALPSPLAAGEQPPSVGPVGPARARAEKLDAKAKAERILGLHRMIDNYRRTVKGNLNNLAQGKAVGHPGYEKALRAEIAEKTSAIEDMNIELGILTGTITRDSATAKVKAAEAAVAAVEADLAAVDKLTAGDCTEAVKAERRAALQVKLDAAQKVLAQARKELAAVAPPEPEPAAEF